MENKNKTEKGMKWNSEFCKAAKNILIIVHIFCIKMLEKVRRGRKNMQLVQKNSCNLKCGLTERKGIQDISDGIFWLTAISETIIEHWCYWNNFHNIYFLVHIFFPFWTFFDLLKFDLFVLAPTTSSQRES